MSIFDKMDPRKIDPKKFDPRNLDPRKGGGGLGGNVPNPVNEVRQIVDQARHAIEQGVNDVQHAAEQGIGQVQHTVQQGVGQVQHAADQGVGQVEGAISAGLEDAEQIVEECLSSILASLQRGVLKKLVSLLRSGVEHSAVTVQLGPVSFEWVDIGSHVSAVVHLADNPPTNGPEVIEAIRGISPDTVTISMDVNLFSEALGAGFSVAMPTEEFLEKAESFLAT